MIHGYYVFKQAVIFLAGCTLLWMWFLARQGYTQRFLRLEIGHKKQIVECFRTDLQDVLLVVNYNKKLYSSVPILKNYYSISFPHIFFCGPETSRYYVEASETNKGYYGYSCLTKAMESYPHHYGYLYINDDLLVNVWTLTGFDKMKVWEGTKLPIKVANFSPPETWYWWKSRWGAVACRSAVIDALNVSHSGSTYRAFMKANGNGIVKCFRGRSDVFYIPHRLALEFISLATTFHKYGVFVEIAVPTILRMLDNEDSFERLNGIYMPGSVGDAPVADAAYLWKYYNESLNFIHPLKLSYPNTFDINYAHLNGRVKAFAASFAVC